MGSELARALNVAGHTVTVSARNPAHAEKVAGELRVATAASNREAVQNVDLVVLAVPSKAVAAVVEDLDDLLGEVIVVDSTNPAGVDREEILRGSASLAEAIQLLAPGTRVVKAFNTVFAGRLNDPVVNGVPLDGFYAGDDPAAKQVVADLLAEMGFRPHRHRGAADRTGTGTHGIPQHRPQSPARLALAVGMEAARPDR
jgi:predicted dinucleotide-binding enzyme